MITNANIFHKQPIPPLIKIREVAKLLSVSRHTVHNLISSGDLLARSVNPTGHASRVHVRVTRESLLKFYRGRFGHTLDRALANPFAMAA